MSVIVIKVTKRRIEAEQNLNKNYNHDKYKNKKVIMKKIIYSIENKSKKIILKEC